MGTSLRRTQSRATHRVSRGPRLETRQRVLRFIRNVFLWLLPVAAVWLVLTPFYNRFLTHATENLVHLSEHANPTRLDVQKKHYFVINRLDLPAPKGWLYSVRVTDTHFPLILLGAFFLAVPGIGWRRRLEALGWALLISVFFHLLSLFVWVKFVYATQLGSWSLDNYGAFGRNVWGLSKHLLDLPFKFSLPFVLWAFFYLWLVLPARDSDGEV